MLYTSSDSRCQADAWALHGVLLAQLVQSGQAKVKEGMSRSILQSRHGLTVLQGDDSMPHGQLSLQCYVIVCRCKTAFGAPCIAQTANYLVKLNFLLRSVPLRIFLILL